MRETAQNKTDTQNDDWERIDGKLQKHDWKKKIYKNRNKRNVIANKMTQTHTNGETEEHAEEENDEEEEDGKRVTRNSTTKRSQSNRIL